MLGLMPRANGQAMEVEVKRIVQVIEQYPETGKKVYQVVYEEFPVPVQVPDRRRPPKRSSAWLQQVEQKETLAIQYTIEMRNMLKDMPVRDEIRDFCSRSGLKCWRWPCASGPAAQGYLDAEEVCADLVWAASANPTAPTGPR